MRILEGRFFANPEFRLSSFDKVRLPQLKGGARPKRKKTNTRWHTKLKKRENATKICKKIKGNEKIIVCPELQIYAYIETTLIEHFIP